MHLLGAHDHESRLYTAHASRHRLKKRINYRTNATKKNRQISTQKCSSVCLSAVGGSVAFGATLQSDARWLRCGKLVQQGFGGTKVVNRGDLRIILEVVWRAFRLIARVEAVNVEAVIAQHGGHEQTGHPAHKV